METMIFSARFATDELVQVNIPCTVFYVTWGTGRTFRKFTSKLRTKENERTTVLRAPSFLCKLQAPFTLTKTKMSNISAQVEVNFTLNVHFQTRSCQYFFTFVVRFVMLLKDLFTPKESEKDQRTSKKSSNRKWQT